MVPAKFTPEQRHDPKHTARFCVYLESNWPGGGQYMNLRMLNRVSIVVVRVVLDSSLNPEYSQNNTEYREMAVSRIPSYTVNYPLIVSSLGLGLSQRLLLLL